MSFGIALTSVFENFSQINLIENTIFIFMTVLSAIVLGLLVVFFYSMVNKGVNFSFEFTLTLIAVSAVIAMIISVIGTNIASAFSLAGLMSIVRFRSLQQKTSDIAFIFISMAAGVACGVGLVVAGLVFVIFIGIVVDIYALVASKVRKESRLLRICVPESESFDKQFDEILDKYTSSYDLRRVRLVSAGTVLEISYLINYPKATKVEDLIRDIREKNSNFNVVLTFVDDTSTADVL